MIELGRTVKDVVTGFKGVVTARCVYLNGCVQYDVKPKVNDKGEMIEGKWFDEEQLMVLSNKIVKTVPVPTGGGKRSHP